MHIPGIQNQVSLEELLLASLGYHDSEGVAFRDEEKPRLQADLGQAKFLMLRNHGLLKVGKSIADAFPEIYRCQTNTTNATNCNTSAWTLKNKKPAFSLGETRVFTRS